MDDDRIQAYLNLIQQLLHCPSGEEPQILQANSELLDLKFLEVCEVVAAQFAESGDENTADFLRSLIGHLEEFLVGDEEEEGEDLEDERMLEYGDFILELLQAIEQNNDGEVIYPILAERQHLLDDRFPEILQRVTGNLLIQHPNSVQRVLYYVESLSFHILDLPLGDRANNIEIAIAGYQIVLSHRPPGSEKWARTQHHIAHAYRHRIAGEKADNLEKAIAIHTSAFQIDIREGFPEDWANAQHHLAIAYLFRIEGEKADNLEKAIAAHTTSLEVYTREDFPDYWAMVQHNLAVIYSDRIKGEKADNLEKAIAFATNALEVYTPVAFPVYWAGMQNSLGSFYSARIGGEKADNLEKAIDAHTAALEVYTRQAFPEQWATTQNYLAKAYRDRIRGEKADNLEKAIALETAALEVTTHETFPQD
ncbi:tetratricopeptide repeat protein [Planktothrix sp. FACHB-1355]|uniref:Tetratricopeptide repeat protein n=1 Tax=Aerosakkonema funiforme FACHB-1375 TaxID=2949571 RepID=A0A926VAA6_9CYAN|nr:MULTISPECIES: tetratricopeptide repeat protein [Oscillatoriales]MBD2179995.1 tetratricopeptide repeat protein [Aerosakkonema funiforme FACHB-1375]MBD3559857.1 tetratricopeptide repeat protein [Planktothrix sp. FACHB-1355]